MDWRTGAQGNTGVRAGDMSSARSWRGAHMTMV